MNILSRTFFAVAVSTTALMIIPQEVHAQELHKKSMQDFCVTEGRIEARPDGTLIVEDSKTRAVLCRGTDHTAEIEFRYRGPTSDVSALGSGAVRTQIGLKLKAQDACNLIYVMWRIAPASSIVVSTKRNPGQRTSAECENSGYQNVKAEREMAVPRVLEGTTHTMRAKLSGNSLLVIADGAAVWEGGLPVWTSQLHGPAGFRTDNGRFDIRFLAAP